MSFSPPRLRGEGEGRVTGGRTWNSSDVAFPQVTGFAERLKIVGGSHTPLAPRQDMIDVQVKSRLGCRTGPACTAAKIIALENKEPKPQRGIARGTDAPANQALIGPLRIGSVAKFYEPLQRLSPRTKAPPVWRLRNGRRRLRKFCSTRLTPKMLPEAHDIFEKQSV